MRRLVAAVAAGTAFGCSTAALHPELVARAAQVRVVRDPEAVRRCAFLQSVSATEEPGYTTPNGTTLDAGTPAITILQLRTQLAGGDTVELTSSERTYRAGVSPTAGRAQTLTTLTGNAYRCASPMPQAGSQAIKDPQPQTGPASSGRWQPWNNGIAGVGRASGIQLIADDQRTNLTFVCLDGAARVLSAGLALGKPAKRDAGPTDISTVQLRFGGEAATSVPLNRNDEGRFLQFYENDASELANLLRMHDQMLARVWLEDGTSEVLEFDVRGFSQAARPVIAACASR